MKKTTAPESIIDQLRAIRAMMEDGAASAGEKANAAVLLERLMQKYCISEDDILERKQQIAAFHYSNPYERLLVFQVAFKIIGKRNISYWDVDPYSGRKSRKTLWFELDIVSIREMELLVRYHKKELAKHLDRMTRAYIHKNELFSNAPAEDGDETKQYDPEEMAQLIGLMKTMEKTVVPRAELPAPRRR